MRIYMQTRSDDSAPLRFYQLSLQQDLLGGWTLYREWGNQGARSSMKREVYLDRDSAVSAFEKARDSQVKRGFRVVFSQGMENSHAH
ncbi:MAG: WGR domain-containing protein [Dokdonella sp.]|jgi:predicted DNA-binding WGR domain protein|uniref:WGR domain-containing protein n=1 Tax=Dokdonella sp. TaxID=2291710 RepID=UPI0025BAD7B3|nr:WGR domain-containing protein [Dokdonella sp.]MBK8123225.1 WGR domain-containing protein [Dokdonella sp.]HNV08588.1 WGR domain-containing protein [Dokdonella sp.]HPW04234.1 WGR domain-containing protein [Dokdonella sp.]HQV48430.1 WGR domain-containing protein [Dokdonella sp.]HQX33079.1 WGR domain-containing protein [Dokdonella sp.]